MENGSGVVDYRICKNCSKSIQIKPILIKIQNSKLKANLFLQHFEALWSPFEVTNLNFRNMDVHTLRRSIIKYTISPKEKHD